MRTIIFLIINILLFSCLFAQQKKVGDFWIVKNSIELNSDTILNNHIKTLVNNDSVQILEYNKFQFEEESTMDERIVYIDYETQSSLKNNLRFFPDQFRKLLSNNLYEFVSDPIKGKVVKNPYPELDNVYLSITKLDNNYILFGPEIDYKVVITDTAIFFKDVEGWCLNKYKNVTKEGNKYVIDLYNYSSYTQRIEIKTIDNVRKIQIWRMTRFIDNKDSYFYGLSIPLNDSYIYPILDIFNTGELDDTYDKFDDIDYVKLFKK